MGLEGGAGSSRVSMRTGEEEDARTTFQQSRQARVSPRAGGGRSDAAGRRGAQQEACSSLPMALPPNMLGLTRFIFSRW